MSKILQSILLFALPSRPMSRTARPISGAAVLLLPFLMTTLLSGIFSGPAHAETSKDTKFILTLSQFTSGTTSLLSTEVKTTFRYPCVGFGLELSHAIEGDTIVVIIGALIRPNPCQQISAEASGRLTLGPFATGKYVLKLQYKIWNDMYLLEIEGDRFSYRPIRTTLSEIIAPAGSLIADTTKQMEQKALRIFLDCPPSCYEDFVKTELASFDYVRDKELANIHLLITSQSAGNGGAQMTLHFMGLQEFSGMVDTLTFTTLPTDTEDMIRLSLVRQIKLGIIRYAARTPLGEKAEISFSEYVSQTPPEQDPWNNWVFSADLGVNLSGQKSTRATQLSASLSANRVTDQLKVQLGVSSSYAEDVFTISSDTYRSIARAGTMRGLLVSSLSEHWSAGGYASLSTSTFDNTRLSLSIAPALEYNFYPYSESTRRECRLLYRIGLQRLNYFSETIFFRTDETLGSHAMSLAFNLKEPWGAASVTLEGSQYLHDLSKNRLVFSGEVAVRVIEGLSFRIYGAVSLIHDQLALPALGATPEEILLQRRELETTYSYYTGFGVSYTFGSIFSNVVNPRFGL